MDVECVKIGHMKDIRTFRNRDARHLVRMVGNQWDLAKRSTGAGRLCDWIYAAEILSQNTEMLVLTDGVGRPVGFAGYAQGTSHRHALRRAFWRLVYIILGRCVKNRDALRRYYAAYDYVPGCVARRFDAECDILIVDRAHRGGAGRVLFGELMRDAAARGVKKMRIDTDDSCNVAFYRGIGAVQVYAAVAQNGGEDETENVYVFCIEPQKWQPPVEMAG